MHPAAVLAAVCAASLVSAQPPAGRPPDIVVVMSDDMGFSDLGCYGGEIRTPRLDALAEAGVRFSQFYNNGRCCPTRASLLTGLYPHQTGVGHMLRDTGLPGYGERLNDRCVTIAEVLRTAGYRTYMCGKWHVARFGSPDGPKDGWPLQRGFDAFYGTIGGGGSYYDPTTLCRGNTCISAFADAEYRPRGGFYYTDAISDHAAELVREHAREHPERPLFLYVAYTAAHWPLHAPDEDVERTRGRYDEGYAALRRARLERLRELGLVDAAWPLTPPDGAWADVPDEQRAWELRCMEVYAAMVERMDRGIGRIVDALREAGRLEDTLLLFLQDNGGCAETIGRTRPEQPWAEYEPMAPGELQGRLRPLQTRDGRPVRSGPDAMPGPDDTFVAYGREWANVSNTPFREYKHWVHEGGIATPLIVHWPRAIAAERRGAVEHAVGHVVDVMATCVDVAGAAYPGEPITPLQGVSLVPAFAGEALPERALFWEHEANGAVREGRYKLVRKGDMRDGSVAPWELYDMQADRTELHDLAGQRPKLVARLARRWQQWAETSQVLPWPWGEPSFSTRTRFWLGPGDALERLDAPHVAGRALRITAELAAAGDGVIVAQGGSTHGYALFVRGGEVRFATRHDGALAVLRCPAPARGAAATVVVRVSRDGTAELAVGGETRARGALPAPLAMPIDGLQVGRDAGGLVGRYGADNEFEGAIESVTIELDG